MGNFLGFQIILNDYLCERKQFRFPKTKKKRIRKKWAKRPWNYKSYPLPDIYRVGDKLVMHPLRFEQFKKELEIQNCDKTK